jgi:ferrochelatase
MSLIKPRFNPEPKYLHGQANKTAVLYCNLGTPETPTASALRTYLAEFLSDPRVVEIPRWVWLIILHGIILRIRPARSAKKYASIWTKDGSPLKVWTQRQARALQSTFNGDVSLATKNNAAPSDQPLLVRYAMRYGSPSIGSELDLLKQQGATRVLILPAYPQYSATTTASLFDSVFSWGMKNRQLPEFRFINHYHDHPGYIQALADNISSYWKLHGRGEKLLMSFHGIPERSLKLGDPYHCECHKTGRLLAEALSLGKDQYIITFQSRFGKAKWLEPYTEPTAKVLAEKGIKNLDIVCPGFTSDCLETIEEIGMEVRETFLNAGGSQFNYIPCLNDSAQWIKALSKIIEENTTGWRLSGPQTEAQRIISKQNALSLGATE